jgi:hypothetical protein
VGGTLSGLSCFISSRAHLYGDRVNVRKRTGEKKSGVIFLTGLAVSQGVINGIVLDDRFYASG